MAIYTQRITPEQAGKVIHLEEGQFSDVKAIEIGPAQLTKAISALANSDGGDLYIGITNQPRKWKGFSNPESANGHIQIFERLFPLGTDFQYEFLKCDVHSGLVLHIQISKTQSIFKASNNIPYVRRGAQSLPANEPEALKRLEQIKGISSFETETTIAPKESIVESEVIKSFIREVVPTSEPEPWLRKQALLRDDKPVVAGVLLFSDEPQAHLPKRCGIKVYRYKTREAEGFREALDFTPKTIEGCLYDQIKQAVRFTKETVEGIPRVGDEALESIEYPTETLHEIITNAILHRDYCIADDVHIRIFDNRIEVQSPGRLPAHITTENILDERFARNGIVVRLLNKFPDPPNKDVGEGLNTAFEAMHQLGLKEPTIFEKENCVLVIIKHEPLASPEEAIMDYLEKNPTIRNREARKIAHVRADYQVKSIFGRMVKRGMIEQIPGTRTSNTSYRLKQATVQTQPKQSELLELDKNQGDNRSQNR
jgi:ATP-dependent DNA helicase RecG